MTPIRHYPYLTAKMFHFIAYLLFLIATDASNYILPASIIGCFHPNSAHFCDISHQFEETPVNYIEPTSPNVIRTSFIGRHKTNMSHLYFTFIAFVIFSTVVLSQHSKISWQPVYHINEHAIYLQPLPPIQEEDENADDEQEDPIPFHYVNPDIQVTCTDPCICT